MWHSWLRSNKCWHDDPVTETQCLSNILEHLLCEWCLQQVAPLSVPLTASQRNICFQSLHIMGHLSWHWIIQGTQLQQKASEGKGVTFNLCQKFCAWAMGEQGKAFLGTDLEMTELYSGICHSTQWHSSALFLERLRTVFPHTLSCKALYQRWTGYCPLDRNHTFNRRLHATAMNISNGNGTALCALFLPHGNAVENF